MLAPNQMQWVNTSSPRPGRAPRTSGSWQRKPRTPRRCRWRGTEWTDGRKGLRIWTVEFKKDLLSFHFRPSSMMFNDVMSYVNYVNYVNYVCQLSQLGNFGSFQAVSKQELTDAPTWVVDPIDGTTNFIHRQEICVFFLGQKTGGKQMVT